MALEYRADQNENLDLWAQGFVPVSAFRSILAAEWISRSTGYKMHLRSELRRRGEWKWDEKCPTVYSYIHISSIEGERNAHLIPRTFTHEIIAS